MRAGRGGNTGGGGGELGPNSGPVSVVPPSCRSPSSRVLEVGKIIDAFDTAAAATVNAAFDSLLSSISLLPEILLEISGRENPDLFVVVVVVIIVVVETHAVMGAARGGGGAREVPLTSSFSSPSNLFHSWGRYWCC